MIFYDSKYRAYIVLLLGMEIGRCLSVFLSHQGVCRVRDGIIISGRGLTGN